MSGEEIRQAISTFGTTQPTIQLQPAPADNDVQYGTIGTIVAESQCIGEGIG